MGWDYIDAGRYEEALDALERAREYHYKSGEDMSKLIADYSVAHVKRLMGDIPVAKTEMEGVLDFATRLHDAGNQEAVEWLGYSRWDLAEIAVAEGDKQTAIVLMNDALAEFERAGMPRWDPDDWQKKQWRLEEISGP
jgi:tetratricopeptide (TPR) repeat protein